LDNDNAETSALHASLEARIVAEIEVTLIHMGYEIVRVQVLGRQLPTVQVMADRADGSLITIEDCEKINDVVSATLDVADIIKSAGHQAKAEVNMPINGRKRFTGIVLGADETVARMRLDDGTDVALPLGDMRRAKLVLTDALIAATARPKPASDPDAPNDVN
jgi:ribosome maturation factor RimP